jgi:hypothetical protein
VNVTEQNNTVVAVNDSSTVPVSEGSDSVNTTIPAGQLSGNVEIETQLYNTSAGTVEATDRLNLTAAAGPGDVTGNGAPAQDPDGDGKYEDINGNGQIDLLDVQFLFANLNYLSGNQAFNINGDSSVDLLDVQSLFKQV